MIGTVTDILKPTGIRTPLLPNERRLDFVAAEGDDGLNQALLKHKAIRIAGSPQRALESKMARGIKGAGRGLERHARNWQDSMRTGTESPAMARRRVRASMSNKL
jgi:hypothetical protein